MPAYAARIFRALKLDPGLFAEVAASPDADRQAFFTVLASSLAAGIGGAQNGGITGMLLSAFSALVGWVVWAMLAFFIGSKLMPEPQTRSDLRRLLRCTGFASAPGLLLVCASLPGLGNIAVAIVSLWMLAAFVLAVRKALDYAGNLRALGVSVMGWLVLMSLTVIANVLSLGRFAW